MITTTIITGLAAILIAAGYFAERDMRRQERAARREFTATMLRRLERLKRID